jgi:hypothetical protein
MIELIDNRAANAASCSGTNATLAALVKRTDPGAAFSVVGEFGPADQQTLFEAPALTWASKSIAVAGQFKSAQGLSVVMDLTTATEGDADQIVASATSALSTPPAAPAGALETFLAHTNVARPAATQVRLRVTLSRDQFTRLIGYVASNNNCVNGFLQGDILVDPLEAHDSDLTLPSPRDFKIPPELRVGRGNAGNAEAILSFRLAASPIVTCRYRGGASVAHPTDPADVAKGLKLKLTSCTNGATSGSTFNADSFKLHLAGGDTQAGRLTVQAPLVCL